MSNTAQTLARGRITAILDENSFVEMGAAVSARATDFNMNNIDTPSDGVITGYGVIGGSLVYVYSQDASVLGGSIGEMHAKKIVRIYDMAMKMGAPVIGLVDCAGLRLQEATDALNAFGELYLKQAMASGVIPQITAVFGGCGGGMAVASAMSDFTFMESKKGRLFVNSLAAGFESEQFVRLFMRSKVAKTLDSKYNRLQWAGEEYMMDALQAEKELRKDGRYYKKERLYWMGYVYRYWNLHTGESSLKILRTAPVRKLHKNYKKLHDKELEEVIAYFKG